MADKVNSIIEEIEQLSVLELNELVKTLEDKFEVSASAPVAAAPAAGQGQEAGGEEEEKTEFDVELSEIEGKKIQVIKAVRESLGLGLKEAKGMVEELPKVIKEGASKDDAEELKSKLEDAGAKVNLK